jgi:hypothetical protein
MGWSSGIVVMTSVVDNFPIRINRKDKRKYYRAIVETLTDLDWDDTASAYGLDEDLDIVLNEYHSQYGDLNEI